MGGGIVRMVRTDGREFDIPIERFVESDRRLILAWSPPEIEVPELDDAMLVLETNDGRGSGFLVQEGGVVWVYTNQHVIGNGSSVTAKNSNGETVALGALQISTDQDIARFVTKERSGLVLADSGETGESILVYGNSQGTGVITRSSGSILGISPESFEVSAEIVSGNSGGPVVNKENEVLGISSYVMVASMGSDPTVAGTRFEKPRRFALRLDNSVDFRNVSRRTYRDTFAVYNKGTKVFDENLDFSLTLFSSPTSLVMVGNYDVPKVVKLVREHNEAIQDIPDYVKSRTAIRNQTRKFYGRYLDTLEDSYEMAEDALDSSRVYLDDPRFGWMLSEIERRDKILEGWKDAISNIEEMVD